VITGKIISCEKKGYWVYDAKSKRYLGDGVHGPYFFTTKSKAKSFIESYKKQKTRRKKK
jgi:hypothetical protein